MGEDSEARACRIAHFLREQGAQTYFVGGCVRDVLLGRVPKDWDIATDVPPARLTALFPGANLVGAQFGVVLVEGIEVATFRSDGAYSDGRRPDQVRYETDPRQDALRRDFTINALFLDPASGEVLDFVGGRDDITRRVIRAVGDPDSRFTEDRLRMLRAVRFAARLGFDIEEATWAALRRLATDVASVAAERVRDELTRILISEGAERGFRLLEESGLLDVLLPEVAAMRGVEQPPEYHPEGDVWVHTLLVLSQLEAPTPTLAWAALLHDVGKPPTFRVADRIRFDGHAEVSVEIARGILQRLRFSSDDTHRILELIAHHMQFKDIQAMRESTLKRFLRQEHFDEHLALHRADVLSSNGNLGAYDFAWLKLEQIPEEEIRPAPLLNGRDLIALGYKPGPEFSLILTQVEEAQLDSRLHSREEALTYVAERFPQAALY